MATYIGNIPTQPRVLSEAEQNRLLAITGESRKGFRDHMIISMALGTGLREHEITGLDIGDILDLQGKLRRRITLRVFKKSCDQPALQEIFIVGNLRVKLDKYLKWKSRRHESLDFSAPLFVSKKGNRLSTRQVRTLFRNWQLKAGFEKIYNVHSLRHSACTNLYLRTKDLRLTQKFARHKHSNTTERYTHPSAEELMRAVQDLPC